MAETNVGMDAQAYTASDIQVLEGMEAVRKRPGMYIGGTGQSGLHHLVFEIVDNAVDEFMAGRASRADIEIQEDGTVCVHDDGHGIPIETHEATGKSAVETVMTTLHAGGKFGGKAYSVLRRTSRRGRLRGQRPLQVDARRGLPRGDALPSGVLARQAHD